MVRNQEKISFQRLLDKAADYNNRIDCTGLSGAAGAFFIYKLSLLIKQPIVVFTPTPEDGKQLKEDIEFFLSGSNTEIIYFPPYNILPFKYLSYHNETSANRIGALYRLLESRGSVVIITTVEATVQKIVPKQELIDFAELVMVGEELERDRLLEKLVSGGYSKTAIVEEPGDFSVRGGIVDIFAPIYPEPLRIEQFGDEVDSIRFFSPATQRTTTRVKEVVVLPAREIVLKKGDVDRISIRVRAQASELGIPASAVRTIIDGIRKEGVFNGSESLIALVYSKLDTFLDYLPQNARFVQVEPERLNQVAAEMEKQVRLTFEAACEEKNLCVEPSQLYLRWSDIEGQMLQRNAVSLKTISIHQNIFDDQYDCLQFDVSVADNDEIRTALKKSRGHQDLLLPLADQIRERMRTGYVTVLACRNFRQAERLKILLGPYGIQLDIFKNYSEIQPEARGGVFIVVGQISSGFLLVEAALGIITAQEMFGDRFLMGRKPRGKPRDKRELRLIAFEDLKKGDLVVHAEHGIGFYQGLVKLKVDNTDNDFLLVTYKDDDKLYLPVERMGVLQKYMGVETFQPRLDKMGGKSWGRIKDRVKKSAERIAGDLLKLYAAREIRKGFAFKEMDSYFRDFEKGFAYDETPDQLKAINDVLNDMSEPKPMDRLVCGDVGYGKTEVALRASFLAVHNGKQVAMLVPTTVLAEQHYATFSIRYNDAAIKVACLNRFRSSSEQKATLNGIAEGTVDIVVGTHRLISKDVHFKDLGLVVVDEEQRFGVRHKEKLKKIRRAVDVLSLTATPIPRTLHLSLMGIRDISVISTPPEYRQAIITYISEFDEAVIIDAINKELARNGQIFFIHNNIHTIQAMAGKLRQLVPGVRLKVAHGRQDEDELEQNMLAFTRKEIDMLVCTTIVESGLDIPSANTILVNRADKFGLSQIYQLRGRVGRSAEQAYAYLFIPSQSTLTENARKRLKVLMEYSDLGSGFQIAMSDLKIRGGGTILGASQSGHIAAVGYDMFLRLMEEAVCDLKGEPHLDELDPEINIQLSAFLPETYIPDLDQRLSAYRRLTKMRDLNELAGFKEELADRYGETPQEAVNLLSKMVLRVLSIEIGVKRIDLVRNRLMLTFSESHQKNAEGLVEMITAHPGRFALSPDLVLQSTLSKKEIKGQLLQIKNILKEIALYDNN